MGWIVTSAASSGVLHISRKVCFARISRYSGRYLPAWRIIHTGVQSTGSRLHAFKNLSARAIDYSPCFQKIGKPLVRSHIIVFYEGKLKGFLLWSFPKLYYLLKFTEQIQMDN